MSWSAQLRGSRLAKLFVVASALLGLFAFQNCGPASMGTSGSPQEAASVLSSTGPTPTPMVNPAVTTIQKLSLSATTVVPGGSFTATYIFDAVPMTNSHSVSVSFRNSLGTTVLTDNHTPPVPTTSWNGRIAYQRTITVPGSIGVGAHSIVVSLSAQPLLGMGSGVTTQGTSNVYVVGTVNFANPTPTPVLSPTPTPTPVIPTPTPVVPTPTPTPVVPTPTPTPVGPTPTPVVPTPTPVVPTPTPTPVLPTPPPIAFVQARAGTVSGMVSTQSVTFLADNKAGNMIIVAVGWNDDTGDVLLVSDSQGNTYVKATGPVRVPTLTQSIYYAKNVKGGPNTVRIDWDAPMNFPDTRISEFSGVNTLDATAQATSGFTTSATPATAPLTLSKPNQLVYAAGMTDDRYLGAGLGFNLIGVSTLGDIHQYGLSGSATSITPTASSGVSTWAFQACSFYWGP